MRRRFFRPWYFASASNRSEFLGPNPGTRGYAVRCEEVDVCVVGGGVVGAFTTLSLAKEKNIKVSIVEMFKEPCHVFGSSHGDGRIFRYAYPLPQYVELAQKAYPGWIELQEFYGQDLLIGRGGLDIGHKDGPYIQGVVSTLEAMGVPFETLGPGRLEAKFPQFSLRKDEVAIYQDDARVARATPTIDAVWKHLRKISDTSSSSSVSALSGWRLSEISGMGNPEGGDLILEILRDSGESMEIKAKRVVLAMGPWIMPFLPKLGLDLPLIGTEERVCHFLPKKLKKNNIVINNDNKYKLSAPDHSYSNMPVFIPSFEHKIPTELMAKGAEHASGLDWGFYGLPEVEIPGVKISAHHTGLIFTDPDKRPSFTAPEANEIRKAEIINSCSNLIAHLLPHLNPVPHHTYTCTYTSTKDHDFIIDVHPKDNRVVIAAGFSGHGFKFGPSIGALISNLAVTGISTSNSPSTSLFSLDRFPNQGLA